MYKMEIRVRKAERFGVEWHDWQTIEGEVGVREEALARVCGDWVDGDDWPVGRIREGGAVVALGDLLQGDVDLGQGHGAHRFADRLFGIEEAVQVSAGDSHRLGDVGDRGLAVAVGAEQLVGELQYLVAAFVFRRAALPGRLSPAYDKYGYSSWGTYSRRHDYSRSTSHRQEHGIVGLEPAIMAYGPVPSSHISCHIPSRPRGRAA